MATICCSPPLNVPTRWRKAASELVNGSEAESAGRLLSLSTLLNAILYTQGQSGAEGELRPLEAVAANQTSTRTSARVLRPVVQALTSTGGGRFEVVKSAYEQGLFKDLRLIDPAIHALGDGYPELADLVAEKILPGYGPAIGERLKGTFELKGKKVDARKLTVLHQIDPAGTVELCKTALEDASADVKAAAVTCLGQHADCLPLVLEQARAKNKQLRAAALEVLAAHDLPEITRQFTELIKGDDLGLLVCPFQQVRDPQVVNALLAEAQRVLDLILKDDSGPIPRFMEILNCLQFRKDATVESFLQACLEHTKGLLKVKASQKSVHDGAGVVTTVVILLYGIGTPAALDALLGQRDALPAATFPQVLRSGLRRWPADKVFTEFSPLLDQKGAKEKREALECFISALHWDEGSRFNPITYDESDPREDRPLKNTLWDARWLDAAIKADQQTIVCCLVRPNHEAAIKYLLKVGEARKTSDSGMIVRALARCEYPKVTDHFLELVTKKTKNAKYYDYELQFLFENARHLPSVDLPKLDAFAAQLDEKFVDRFLEAIAPLRSAPQAI